MKADLPENIVKDIMIAVVLEGETVETKNWTVYVINDKNIAIQNVLISSKGYGEKDGRQVTTTTLRHFIGNIAAKSFDRVEAIDEQVFGLTNEYWVSFYIDNIIYDKKYIFLPESIVDGNLMKVPLVNQPGVIIGGNE
ncbi:hypothetical protein [Sphingobacterium sp. 2149]|uniref:hypothetical protein n=1 Tax=Sphingobacterium sp. 2149 TaxID=2817763 RepID=UPI001AE478AA|nr:hypothetical protein [Sphingobacterium sp. 2149]MDR6734674.1 hypothetical protein [Sphingobacterium sp. 2149]